MDQSTDDSSDELYSSYSTFAKRTYEDAVKKAAHGKEEQKEILLDSSSDSEKGKSLRKKVKGEKNHKKRNTKITGSKKASASSKSKSRKEEEETILISSESDSIDCLIKKNKPTLATQSINDELDYDTEPEIEKANQDVVTLSDLSDVEIVSPEIKKRLCKDTNELMSIKICWRLQPIQKFQLRRHQKFQSLLEHFAELERVPIEQIVIYGGKDNLRSIEPYDTPDSIGITITDVLEGGVLSKGSVKHSGLAKRYRDPSEADGEEIELRVQQEQTRSFPLLVKKHQKMKVLFIKVAEQLETETNKVKLFLDGEPIDPESTPLDLDLDNGDVLDVVISEIMKKKQVSK